MDFTSAWLSILSLLGRIIQFGKSEDFL
jgi:hypothetical protein